MNRALTAPARLLLWCAGGTVAAQLVLARIGAGNPDGFSPIFFYLLKTFDTHGNVVLFAAALCAFALRRRAASLRAIDFLAERPWWIAGAAFPLLCFGSLGVYHAYPLSMDEYLAAFQAKAFSAGRLSGVFPPELMDRLVPKFFQDYFFSVSRTTGEISTQYWPGFALVMAPFAWLGAPWAANPALTAATIPLIHRLAKHVSGGSAQAAGWAVALTLASPVFVVSGISYYSMAAHLFFNLLYALLLLQPTPLRAGLAGIVGSIALTLHNPVPHMLFCLPFFVWLALRPRRFANLAALLVGYLPLVGLLGIGWHRHIAALAAASPAAAASVSAVAPAVIDTVLTQLGAFLKVPSATTVHARIAGLSKMWTWGAAGLIVFAAYGYRAASRSAQINVLGAALLLTFLGYFLVRFDQGHGWGYRYIHSAWFVLPVLAAIFFARPSSGDSDELRAMAAWAVILSLVLANGLRLVQVESFIARQLAQVPPLLQPVAPGGREIVFIHIGTGFYTQDMVQNDPFLRAPRMVMVYDGAQRTAEFMARNFPGYAKRAAGDWGELWHAQPN
jgi:hypothetical protein